MKKSKSLIRFTFSLLALCLFFTFNVFGSENFPKTTNLKYINDYTNAIDQSTVKSIVSIGKELEDKTGAQAVIVVIDSTNNIPIEDYANNLFRTWGIGEKDKDNGILILLALNDKSWRVEVGRGLEGEVPDALTNRVMDQAAKPSFINGDYGEGLLNSYSIISDYVAAEYGVTLEKSLNITLPNETQQNSGGTDMKIAIIVFLGLLFLDIFLNRGRVSSFLLQILFWSNFNNRRGGPGGFGGGSSGGGFGGFGGGSSNGGGSSGGW